VGRTLSARPLSLQPAATSVRPQSACSIASLPLHLLYSWLDEFIHVIARAI
jgi:hypothetical protein